LLIDIRDIKKSTAAKKKYCFDEDIDIYENGSLCPLISVEAEFTNAGKTIIVKGILRSEIEIQCCKCLEPFSCKIDASFREEFLPYSHQAISSKKMMSPEDLDIFFYENDTIDLKEICRQLCLVSIPLMPLCKENCKGLCGSCGENLNISECSCNN